MSAPDFSTSDSTQQLAQEVSCLKAFGQADAGRVILKMEKQIAQIDDENLAAVYSSTVKQIKQAYRQ